MHRAARQLMLLLTVFAWMTANIHSAVAHCVCADACHEAYSAALENKTGPGVFIGAYSSRDCAHHEPALESAAGREPEGRGCCDSPDADICLEHTQELVSAPVSYGSNSLALSQSLSQFVLLQVCLVRVLICADVEDPADARAAAGIPVAEDARASGWSHLVHTALPVRGPSILA